ncbi:MAG: hypothetical protein ACK58L_04515 [Planctomycetota bacterium]
MTDNPSAKSYRLPGGLSATIVAVVISISSLVLLRPEAMGITWDEAVVVLGAVFALPIFTVLWLLSYRISTNGQMITVSSILGSHKIDFTNKENFQLLTTPVDIGRPTAKGITTKGKQITVWIQLMRLEDCVDLLQFLGFDFKISDSEPER